MGPSLSSGYIAAPTKAYQARWELVPRRRGEGKRSLGQDLTHWRRPLGGCDEPFESGRRREACATPLDVDTSAQPMARWRNLGGGLRRDARATKAISCHGDAVSFGRDVFGPIVTQFCLMIWLYATEAEKGDNPCLLFCARGGVGIREAFEQTLAKLRLPVTASAMCSPRTCSASP